MAVEREVKLVAPARFQLPALDGVTKGAVAVATAHRRLDATYYDSVDLRLARSGVTLRYRTGEDDPVWTLKLPDDGAGSTLVREELDFTGVPETVPEQARDLVRAYLRSDPLVQVARLATERTTVEVHDARRHQTVEVVDDLVTATDLRQEFREVEVETKTGESGRDELTRAVVARLVSAGCRAERPVPKLARALGPSAQAPADIVVPELGKKATIQELVHHAVAASVARIVRYDAGVRLGADPEQLHQFRVGTRRLRSDLRTFAPLLEPGWVESLRAELQWLGGEVGVVRDCDVLAERLRAQTANLPEVDAEAVAALLGHLDSQTEEARAAMLVALRSDRYDALVETLADAAHQPRFAVTDPVRATKQMADFVRGPWRRLARSARELGAKPTDEALHQVRILAKRCRYAAEAVALVAGKRASRFAAGVARIQTVLGEHQDTVVAESWLRAAAEVVPGSALVAGELIARQCADRVRLRSRWSATWAKASRQSLRTWLE